MKFPLIDISETLLPGLAKIPSVMLLRPVMRILLWPKSRNLRLAFVFKAIPRARAPSTSKMLRYSDKFSKVELVARAEQILTIPETPSLQELRLRKVKHLLVLRAGARNLAPSPVISF